MRDLDFEYVFGPRWNGLANARNILHAALDQEVALVEALGTAIHALFKPFGGATLEIPPREPMCERTAFEKMTGKLKR